MANILCRELMTKEVVTCTGDMSAREVAELLGRRDIGSLPVVDNDGHLVGIVTDRDLVIRVMARDLPPGETPVSEVMSTELVTVNADDEVDEATEKMMQRQVRRVFVVTGDGSLLGVIAQADIASRGRDRILTAQLVERVSKPGIPELVPGGIGRAE
jgi:CBS domain-containing protein